MRINKIMIEFELVITADDLGISDERNLGIIDAMLNGCVTSTSAMVNGPASIAAFRLLRHHGLENKCGLHLNLTEGPPLYQLAPSSSLLRSNLGLVLSQTWEYSSGPLFLGKADFIRAIEEGRIEAYDIEQEVRAQVL